MCEMPDGSILKEYMPMYLQIPIERLFVSSKASLHDAIQTIQRGAKQIALVVDENQHLLGTITDGDIRRAIVCGRSKDSLAEEIMQQSFTVATQGTNSVEIFELMRVRSLRHIPLLNDDGQVIDLAWISDLIAQDEVSLSAVVMAGGFGRRLCPLTDTLPKPMLPVGGRPIMDRIIQQLRETGIRRITVTTHYHAEKITEYFGDGKHLGVELNYVREDHPLGTAGALGLMNHSSDPVLVVNGDILTRLDFHAMFSFHQEHRADLTVAVRRYDFEVPYGVVECDGWAVQGISEKPKLNVLINAGVYVLDPSVQRYVPRGKRCEMTDLIQFILKEGGTVVNFPIIEYWIDIGQHAQYQQAQNDIEHYALVGESLG